MWTLSCSRWHLAPHPGIEHKPHELGVQSLNHWTTREVPKFILKDKEFVKEVTVQTKKKSTGKDTEVEGLASVTTCPSFYLNDSYSPPVHCWLLITPRTKPSVVSSVKPSLTAQEDVASLLPPFSTTSQTGHHGYLVHLLFYKPVLYQTVDALNKWAISYSSERF